MSTNSSDYISPNISSSLTRCFPQVKMKRADGVGGRVIENINVWMLIMINDYVQLVK